MLHADRSPAGVVRAAIGGFHQAGPAAGHHRETEQADAAPQFARDGIVRMRLAEPGRPEHGDARPAEMQRAKPADEIAHGAPQQLQFAQP